MTNHLSNQTSPYLLQHAENPVDWYPWGEAALSKARTEDKPIFLSIGYAACHWCHVMAHESFEDPDIAKVLNQFFISIKVDREERPDIDSLYMSSVVAMTGQGGWPMSMFLKPTGEPFFAGTYFPPERRYGMPGFKEILFNIRHIWQKNRKEIDQVSDNMIRHLKIVNRFKIKDDHSFELDQLEGAASELLSSYNQEIQGWGPAPLFPHPIVLEFLLQMYSRNKSSEILTVVTNNLNAMSSGGMWDEIGGGFHRYSTDDQWLIPHFEKMLYDNAQLALVYLHAYLITRNEDYRITTERTLDFILREMTSPTGGFFSSLDADSEGEEGTYYTWTSEEIRDALANPEEFKILKTVFQMDPSEKINGKFLLKRKLNNSDAAKGLNISLEIINHRLAIILRKLHLARFTRIRPATDDKVLVMWNALAGQAFSEAARFLNRQDYLLAAKNNADFITKNLFNGIELYRSYRNGQANQPAFLEDYASLILFMVDLYQSDQDQQWFTFARILTEKMIHTFNDPEGGYFDTGQLDKTLIVRPKSIQDNATPSGSALTAHALLIMSELDNHPDWREMAEEMLSSVHDLATAHPLAFSAWLQAADLAVGPVDQVAIVSPPAISTSNIFTQVLWSAYRPRLVAAFSATTSAENAPRLLANRPLLKGQTSAYVCHGFVCLQPTSATEEFERQLIG